MSNGLLEEAAKGLQVFRELGHYLGTPVEFAQMGVFGEEDIRIFLWCKNCNYHYLWDENEQELVGTRMPDGDGRNKPCPISVL